MKNLRDALFDNFMRTKNGTVFGNGVKIQVGGVDTHFIRMPYFKHIDAHLKTEVHKRASDLAPHALIRELNIY